MAVTLVAAFCSACSGNQAIRSAVSRDPGPPPAYMQPIEVKDPKVKDYSIADAKLQEQGREIANAIIVCGIEDWEKMRARMIAADTSLPAEGDPECVKAVELATPVPKAKSKKRRR